MRARAVLLAVTALEALGALGATAIAAPDAPHKTRARAKAQTSHAKSHASSRFDNPPDPDATPAVRYGAMSPAACEAELDTRHIAYTKEDARGVLDPIRLTGALHGVEIRTDASDARRADSPYEIVDCREALALDDFAQILERHDIVQIRHYSMYRPPPKSWPDDKIGAQHRGALALDAGRFIKKDGSVLDVLKDFHGKIGAPTCGEHAGPHPATATATELREILCAAVEAHLFNVVLTPDFNRPHRNHFHLEVMANVKWFLVH